MTDLNFKELNDFRDFCRWRKENPEEYKEFLKDFKEVMIDMKELLEDIY